MAITFATIDSNLIMFHVEHLDEVAGVEGHWDATIAAAIAAQNGQIRSKPQIDQRIMTNRSRNHPIIPALDPLRTIVNYSNVADASGSLGEENRLALVRFNQINFAFRPKYCNGKSREPRTAADVRYPQWTRGQNGA